MSQQKSIIPSISHEERAADENSASQARPRSYPWKYQLLINILLRLIAWSTLAVGLYCVYEAIIQRSPEWLTKAGGFTAAFALLKLLSFLEARKYRCTLCHGLIFQESNCSKHRDVRRLPILGYKGVVMLNLLLKRTFHCIYCGTWFRTK